MRVDPSADAVSRVVRSVSKQVDDALARSLPDAVEHSLRLLADSGGSSADTSRAVELLQTSCRTAIAAVVSVALSHELDILLQSFEPSLSPAPEPAPEKPDRNSHSSLLGHTASIIAREQNRRSVVGMDPAREDDERTTIAPVEAP